MNSIKCPNCTLVNFETDFSCRRCGTQLHPSTSRYHEPPKPPKKGISIFSIILIGAVIAFVAWAYTNIQKEMSEIDVQRKAAQPANGQVPMTRTGEQKARTAAYASAVQNNSQGLAESKKHLQTIEQHSNSQGSR